MGLHQAVRLKWTQPPPPLRRHRYSGQMRVIDKQHGRDAAYQFIQMFCRRFLFCFAIETDYRGRGPRQSAPARIAIISAPSFAFLSGRPPRFLPSSNLLFYFPEAREAPKWIVFFKMIRYEKLWLITLKSLHHLDCTLFSFFQIV